MAVSTTTNSDNLVTQQLNGLALTLVREQLLSDEAAQAIQTKANETSQSFVQTLIASGQVPAKQIAMTAAQSFGFPFLDIGAFNTDFLPENQIDPEVMVENQVVGLKTRNNVMFVAIADPSNLATMDTIRFQVGKTLAPIVVEADKLRTLINSLTEDVIDTVNGLINEDDFDFEEDEPEAKPKEDADEEVDDAPIVKFINKMLHDAINMGASDLHFEPYEKFYRIRYRIDGVLQDVAQPPLAIKDKLASRIKVISNMDISEKRVPQDGRMKLVISKNRAIDFRVSTLPLVNGEKIVMRILDPTSATLGIDALGYEEIQKKNLLEAVHRPYGLVLVTGPTGSGKTVSLYTCLNILNNDSINISTAEDPCEIPLAGINQVNVNDKQGLTFAAALKSFLRQDPDVIMIGEIRDLETADMAIKAASTGHMVLSTLHTNDAPSTLTRLMNMGVAAFNIASAVTLITAQRLGRRLCKSCKVPVDRPPKEAMLELGFTQEDIAEDWQLYGPNNDGCEACTHGYKGRVGIYQVMPISDEISRIIMKNGTAHDIADQAALEGIKDLRQSGLMKVKQGLTSIEEVESVTNE